MRLFFHFANLYDGHHKKRLAFPKRYDDICTEWLGGLTIQKHQSLIERDQLGPHLRQLIQIGVLSSYAITKARTRDGFVITFRPGTAFFTDYDRFYRNRGQTGLQFEFHSDRRDISEPLKVAYLFIEKRSGRARRDIPYVPSKDVETAKYLLNQLPSEEVGDFLDYALAEAKKTNFEVQTLGGLKQYLTGFLSSREQRAATVAAAVVRKKREQEEAERIAYDQFRRSKADDIYATLPASEQAIITELARPAVAGFGIGTGSLAKILFEGARTRITAERHDGKIPTLEQWKCTLHAQKGTQPRPI